MIAPVPLSRAEQIRAVIACLESQTDTVEVIIRGAGRRFLFEVPAPAALPPPPAAAPLALSEMEANVVESLGAETMTGQQVADKAGYAYDGSFRACLAALRRRGVLGGASGSAGYFVANP